MYYQKVHIFFENRQEKEDRDNLSVNYLSVLITLCQFCMCNQASFDFRFDFRLITWLSHCLGK